MVLPNSKEESITWGGDSSPESNGAESSRKKKKMVTERKKEVSTIAFGQYGLLRILKTLIVVRGSLTYCLFEVISVSMDRITSRWNPSCFRKVWILLLFSKMPKEVEDFLFSQIREVTSEKNNEKVGGIKSIKNGVLNENLEEQATRKGRSKLENTKI